MDIYAFTIALIALFLIYRVVMRVVFDEQKKESDTPPGTEAELLRELHHGLARMEKRIEALETLLADREEAPRTAAGENKR